jgi:hypothetical protein
MFIYYTYNSLYKTVQTGTGRYEAGKELKKKDCRKKENIEDFLPFGTYI